MWCTCGRGLEGPGKGLRRRTYYLVGADKGMDHLMGKALETQGATVDAADDQNLPSLDWVGSQDCRVGRSLQSSPGALSFPSPSPFSPFPCCLFSSVGSVAALTHLPSLSYCLFSSTGSVAALLVRPASPSLTHPPSPYSLFDPLMDSSSLELRAP